MSNLVERYGPHPKIPRLVHSEVTNWLEAHGINASRVSASDSIEVDTSNNRITYTEFSLESGQQHADCACLPGDRIDDYCQRRATRQLNGPPEAFPEQATAFFATAAEAR